MARVDLRRESNARQRDVRRILKLIGYMEPWRNSAGAASTPLVDAPDRRSRNSRGHPFLRVPGGFSWAATPMEFIDGAVGALGTWVQQSIAGWGAGAGLLVDGIIRGAGSVLVFLPQILILFFFILAPRRQRLPAPRRVPAGPA